MTDRPLPGEQAIASAELVALPNQVTSRDYLLHFSYPEFTCKCPMTGYPDFAVIDLWVLPAAGIVELKSLKLYLNRYRDRYIFHEDATNAILDDVVAAIEPKWARIVATWNPRGNLATRVMAEHNSGLKPSRLLEETASESSGKPRG